MPVTSDRIVKLLMRTGLASCYKSYAAPHRVAIYCGALSTALMFFVRCSAGNGHGPPRPWLRRFHALFDGRKGVGRECMWNLKRAGSSKKVYRTVGASVITKIFPRLRAICTDTATVPYTSSYASK